MIDANSTTENFTRRALWAQIDLDAAAHNMRVIRKHVGPDVRIAAVVKANAYGHGAVELSRVFAENGADCFAVSWMGIISVVELIITWDFPKRTGWKIFVV